MPLLSAVFRILPCSENHDLSTGSKIDAAFQPIIQDELLEGRVDLVTSSQVTIVSTICVK